MRAAHQTLEEFRSSAPSGIGLEIVLDQNRYVEARLNNLFQNLLFGAILVVATTAFYAEYLP